MTTLVLVGLIGGLLFMDRTPVGNFMLSRPVVAGPAMGFVVGEPMVGLWVGALFELLWISAAPIGAYLPPDDTLAAGASVAAYGMSGLSSLTGPSAAAAVALTIVLGIPACYFGKAVDTRLRRSNIDYVHWTDREVAGGSTDAVERSQYYSLLGFFSMGAALALAYTLGQALVLKLLFNFLPEHAILGLAAFLVLLPPIGIASAMAMGAPSRRSVWLGVGLFSLLLFAGTLRLL